jgi:hypothetical protein
MMVPNESQLTEERNEPLLVKAESKLNFVQPFFFLGGEGVFQLNGNLGINESQASVWDVNVLLILAASLQGTILFMN